MRPATLRAWSRIHTWSSLVCTGFLLLPCVTGLPLIFHHEIDALLGDHPVPAALRADAPRASLDRLAESAMARRPGEVVQYVIWDPDEPDLVWFSLAPTPTSPPEALQGLWLDARTAEVLKEPDLRSGFMYWMLRLHVDLFAGLPGKLFLGAMGLLFAAAIVSGVVLYGPFMRRLEFGTIRTGGRSRRLHWLDLHNLLGVVTVVWALVVGITGVVNTLAELILEAWRRDQLAELVAPWQGLPPVAAPPGTLERAVAAARTAAPGHEPAFVAYPQTPFSSGHHYAVYLRGSTPLTRRLLIPALVEAESGVLTALRPVPWYGTALQLSQPLHFGDYGGLPLKVIWALLDLATIAVLASGLVLWVRRRRGARRAPRAAAGHAGQAAR